MVILTLTEPKRLTSGITFSKYISIFDAYYKTPKLYGMENISAEEVRDKLDLFQYRFVKIDKLGWWN